MAIRGTSPDMTTVFYAWLYGRFIEIQSNLRREKLHRTKQGSNLCSFSNKNSVTAPIQLKRESQPQHLKRWFSSRTDPSIFTLIAPVLLDQSNETSWVVVTDQMPDHNTSESNIISRVSNITYNIIRKVINV